MDLVEILSEIFFTLRRDAEISATIFLLVDAILRLRHVICNLPKQKLLLNYNLITTFFSASLQTSLMPRVNKQINVIDDRRAKLVRLVAGESLHQVPM